MRKIDTKLNIQRKLFVGFIFVGLCLVVGPFGTYATMTLIERSLFWTIDTFVCLIAMQLSMSTVFAATPFAHMNDYAKLSMAAFVSAALNYGFVYELTNAVSPDALAATSRIRFAVEITLSMHVMLFVEFVLWDRILYAIPHEPETLGGNDNPLSFSDTNLAQRVPDAFANAELYAISMEDHYAVIYTPKGPCKVLLRLEDAIDLLEGLPGLQVHRSHWVPISAMVALHKNGRRYSLQIKSGAPIPVSQSYLQEVQKILEK
jgi:hypothetical protein